MAKFTELTVITSHEGADLVSDILWEYSAQGVAVTDVEDVIALERAGKTWDYADESIYSADKSVLCKAFLQLENSDESIKQIELRLLELKKICPFDLGSLETKKRVIDGDEWKDIWKEHFRPIRIGRIVIVPEWIDYPNTDEIKVVIGSNMAFGTGEHETTSMCVEYLDKYTQAGSTVIDVGCGSGILGISASKLGANDVIMTDIDECAISATQYNMKLNGVKNGKVLLKNLLDDESIKGDVVVCNIMAEVLIAFAPHIGKNVKDDGIIILSGILSDRLERVKDAYIGAGFKFVEQKIKGEWSAVVFQKVI